MGLNGEAFLEFEACESGEGPAKGVTGYEHLRYRGWGTCWVGVLEEEECCRTRRVENRRGAVLSVEKD